MVAACAAPFWRVAAAVAPFALAACIGAAVLAATGHDPLAVYRLMVEEAFSGQRRARLMTNPRCSVVGGSRRGSSAPAPIGSVAELAEPRASKGPLTSQLVMSTAMKFNIRVVTTSSTPRLVRASAGPI